MSTQDRFGNEIRRITDEEKELYQSEIKKMMFKMLFATIIAVVGAVFMITYFIRNSDLSFPVAIVTLVVFLCMWAWLAINSIANLRSILNGDLGIMHIYSEDIEVAPRRSKRPMHYIQGREMGTDKKICYSIGIMEYRALSDHYGHLREIDYIVVNPDRIRYKSHWYFYTLENLGAPIIESAVFDSIDKSVKSLLGDILSVKKR